MYSGSLINDLLAIAERAHVTARSANAQNRVDMGASLQGSSESKEFPQPLGLSPADWNLGLLLVIHSQLVRALEPRDNFADAIDVHQIGAVCPPKKIRV